MLSDVLNHPFGVLLPVMLAAAGIGSAIWSSASARNANRALRITLLGLAAAAAGVAAWTAGYVAIATHDPAFAVGFDPIIVSFDLLLLVCGFAIAFATASYSNGLDGLAAGGLISGLTLAGGQYLALLGMTPAGHVSWSQMHVELSVVVTIAAAVLGFIVLGRSTRIVRTAGSLVLMTIALFAIQRLALHAMIITPGEAHALHPADLTPTTLQILVAGFYGLTGFLVTGAAVMHVKSKTGALAQLREAIEAMPAGLAFYDKDDRLVMWNSTYAEVAGAAREALAPGRTFRELLAADIKGGSYLAAQGREEAWLDERIALRASGAGAQEQALEDGRWLRVEDRRTADGGVVSICTNITDLRAREDSFRLLFAGNPVAMVIMRHGTLEFIDANQAAADLYGFSREELLTKSVFEMMAPDERDVLTDVMALDAKADYQGDKIWKQIRADGTEIHVLPYGRAIPYGEGSAFMAAYIDVTSQVRATEALEQARAAADAANRSKSEFLANMSHEIRTPLNGVIGVADVLASTQLAQEQLDMLQVIRSSGRTLERLLADVLDLARIESGHVRFEQETFQLGDAVRHAAAVCEMRAREKGVGFAVDIEAAADTWVVSDPVRIKQVVTNLVSNAVKFTDKGEVRVELRRDARDVFPLSVTDTGVGFDPDKKDQIFARFQQADGSITRRFGGTGLGLAICKQIAELMGGELDCDSTPGEGSVFTLVAAIEVSDGAGEAAIPIAEPRKVAQTKTKAKAKTVVSAVADAPEEEPDNDQILRVLLADDHPTNRKVVELILAQAGVELVQVEDGAQAVEAYGGQAFDLVLMDMQMPVQDGLSATRAIRDLEQASGRARTPIIMLTANALPEHVAAASAAGADRHLSKPITAAALLSAVQEAVSEGGSDDSNEENQIAVA
jgi:PAS domain S-box-containing protein